MSAADRFERECPILMALGMSREEYWFGNIFAPFDYIEADRWKQERFNQQAWLQGMYVADATFTAIANAFAKRNAQRVSYPSKPYEFTKPKKNKADNNDVAFADAWMKQLVQVGANWGNK